MNRLILNARQMNIGVLLDLHSTFLVHRECCFYALPFPLVDSCPFYLTLFLFLHSSLLATRSTSASSPSHSFLFSFSVPFMYSWFDHKCLRYQPYSDRLLRLAATNRSILSQALIIQTSY